MDLETLGWNQQRDAAFAPYRPALVPARVIEQQKKIYRIRTAASEPLAEVSGRFRHAAAGPQDFPAVGDWVAVHPTGHAGERAIIEHLLPRTSTFSRKAAGSRVEEQVVAANIDTVFLVIGLDHDYKLRRIERYLTVAWESGASPVLLLNKLDLCDDPHGRLLEVEGVAPGVPVHLLSSLLGEGLQELSPYLRAGQTVALLGSSGVGKSTIVNALLGRAEQRVQEVRASDSRGRHTTTHRELFVLADGGLLIDTPGMRELQLWEGGEGLQATFEDVEDLARQCAFSDCTHRGEARCAVAEAMQRGLLSRERLDSYRKLQRELRHIATKQDFDAELRKRRHDKNAVKAFNKHMRRRD